MSYGIGIIGCGDFLRWQAPELLKSEHVSVKALFDPRQEQAEKFATKLGGRVENSAEAIYQANDVDIVLLFVPPWARADCVEEAASSGKHILTTKPLSPNNIDCQRILDACSTVKAGVIYNRTDNELCRTARRVFQTGEIGQLALFKQDWIHHYPKWNNWATDPEKNGGPFMDAMIHNLNIARYLLDDSVTSGYFSSSQHSHPELACADTEFLKIDTERGASAHLFITWAADLHYQGTTGNDREHIDQLFMVTDHGWHCTEVQRNGQGGMLAHKHGEDDRFFAFQPRSSSIYDLFALHLDGEADWPQDLPSIEEAASDIELIRYVEDYKGQCFNWSDRGALAVG